MRSPLFLIQHTHTHIHSYTHTHKALIEAQQLFKHSSTHRIITIHAFKSISKNSLMLFRNSLGLSLVILIEEIVIKIEMEREREDEERGRKTKSQQAGE